MIKAIKNFFKVWKRDGFKKTWKQLQYNYIMLETPEEQLKKEIFGYGGMLLGLGVAVPWLFFRGSYPFVVAVGFGFYINLQAFRGKIRQLWTLRDIKKKFETVGGVEDV